MGDGLYKMPLDGYVEMLSHCYGLNRDFYEAIDKLVVDSDIDGELTDTFPELSSFIGKHFKRCESMNTELLYWVGENSSPEHTYKSLVDGGII